MKPRARAAARATPEPSVREERVARIVAAAALDGTRVVSARAHAHPQLMKRPSFDATSRYGASAAEITRSGPTAHVTVLVHFITESTAREPERPLLCIEVQRFLEYSGIPSDVTDAELQAFAATTGLFNAWPFLRADVHGLSLQLGLNPITMPLLRPRRVQAVRAPRAGVDRAAPRGSRRKK